MARQPTVGGDFDAWGTVLNEYLSVSHDASGHLGLSGNPDFNNYQAIDFVLEKRATVATALTEGRVYYRTDTDLIEYDTGTVIRTMVTTADTQTLTKKTLTQPVITNYTDATRPGAGTVESGTMIFNTDDGAPNWSDGTNWLDATGTVT